MKIKSKRNSRKKSKRKSRIKSRRKSRIKSRRKSRRKSKRKTRKGSPKYERCVLAVKSKQPKKCMKNHVWIGGKGCYNPWAVCTAKVGRYG